MGDLQGGYKEMIHGLLPVGQAWERRADSVLSKIVEVAANEMAAVHGRSDILLAEADPRQTFEMLSDWERVAGLPDNCAGVDNTIQERRAALVQRLTSLGGQSRAYFYQIAEVLGYTQVQTLNLCLDDSETVSVSFDDSLNQNCVVADFILTPLTIEEFRPFTCGLSECSLGQNADGVFLTSYAITDVVAFRDYWRVNVSGPRVTWFVCGLSECGRDPLAKISRAVDLECILNRLKPAHTDLIFAYEGI